MHLAQLHTLAQQRPQGPADARALHFDRHCRAFPAQVANGAAAAQRSADLARFERLARRHVARGPGEGGDGDLRFTFNKSSASDVLSLLFQSGWSGRAEIGLIGDDDLRLKVSPDGATWVDALSVDADTGRCAFPLGAARIETTVLTADGGWTPPAWDWACRRL